MMFDIHQQLKTVFGFETFQAGQEVMIEDILAEKNVLGILPTGSGKSLCYQLPATLLPGLTIVVSPLISLMVDQVRQVKAYYFKEVAAIHSFLSYEERQEILNHLSSYKLLFVSPELLQQTYIIQRLKQSKISLFCVDEAHCISQWGYDFRTDYLKLKSVIQQLEPAAVLALTGTASSEVQQDIQDKLGLPSMKKHIYSMARDNIALVVEQITGNEDDKVLQLIDKIYQVEWPLIIYFSSRKRAEYVAEKLMLQIKEAKTTYYHAGLSADNRLKIQEQFLNHQIDIICSTSAFGMGINKKDIRTVIHYHPPSQIESYIQEIGRAGRDSKQSLSILFFRDVDFEVPRVIIENELPTANEIKRICYDITEKYILINDKKIIAKYEISEVKWSFIKYHLEAHNFIIDNKIITSNKMDERFIQMLIDLCASRQAYKTVKLAEVKRWAYSKTCLHQGLYGLLQENVKPLNENCCSNCGLTLPEVSHLEKRKNTIKDTDWQSILTEHLFYKEINHEKKSS